MIRIAQLYALAGILGLFVALALGTVQGHLAAAAGSITCYSGSTGSPAAYSSQTICDGQLLALEVNSTLSNTSGVLDSVSRPCLIPLIACNQVVAGRVFSSSGGIHLVAGTHFAAPPPGYNPPAGYSYTSYLFNAP